MLRADLRGIPEKGRDGLYRNALFEERKGVMEPVGMAALDAGDLENLPQRPPRVAGRGVYFRFPFPFPKEITAVFRERTQFGDDMIRQRDEDVHTGFFRSEEKPVAVEFVRGKFHRIPDPEAGPP